MDKSDLEKQIFDDVDKSGLEKKINDLLNDLENPNFTEKKMVLTRYVLADTAMRSIVEFIQGNTTKDEVRKQAIESPILLDVLKSVMIFLVLCKKFGLASEVSNDNKKD